MMTERCSSWFWIENFYKFIVVTEFTPFLDLRTDSTSPNQNPLKMVLHKMLPFRSWRRSYAK